MLIALLDVCFNLVCERLLLGGGARVLWWLRGRRGTLEEQMQATLPDLCAGTLAWGAGITALCLALP